MCIVISGQNSSFRTFQITSVKSNLHRVNMHSLQLLILTHLHELVLQTLKAVEADSRHIAILQCDGAFCGFVLSDKREVLKWIVIRNDILFNAHIDK